MNSQTPNTRVNYRSETAYDIPAKPQQIWEAIATSEGISSWMTSTVLEPRVGGLVAFDFGDFTSTGTVTAYEPEARIEYEEPWPIAECEDEIGPEMTDWFAQRGLPLSQVYDDLKQCSPIATEFIIESRSGGSCVVRIVTSAYGNGADWENEFFAEMVETTRPIWDRLVAHFTSAVAK